MSAGRPLVDVRDLVVEFAARSGDRGTVRAVDGVSFAIKRGETLGLVGESGSGKSTVARALVGLNEPAGGSVRFDGTELVGIEARELRAMRRSVQLVFQDPYANLNPAWTVAALVEEPLKRLRGLDRAARRRRAEELLDTVGLTGRLLSRRPRELSGGQRQRVGIARALAAEPEMLVCDEPVSALDVSIQAQVLNLLVELRDQLGLTCLFIAHDLSVVRWICDRVAVMYCGQIVELGTTAQVFEAPTHPYTRALISAAPSTDPEVERARRPIVLQGEVPSPLDVAPAGCRFRERCWLHTALGRPERCATERPALEPSGEAQLAACHFSERTATAVAA